MNAGTDVFVVVKILFYFFIAVEVYSRSLKREILISSYVLKQPCFEGGSIESIAQDSLFTAISYFRQNGLRKFLHQAVCKFLLCECQRQGVSFRQTTLVIYFH